VKPASITFKDGSVRLSEKLAGGVGYWYEFEGIAGQQLNVGMKSGKSPATLSLYYQRQNKHEPLVEHQPVWNGMLVESGKYLLKVPARDEEYTFALKLIVK
jgi:hypothetical protein